MTIRNASKEECRESIKALARYEGVIDPADFDQLAGFLQAAERRLPSESSIARDKARKARYHAERKKQEGAKGNALQRA